MRTVNVIEGIYFAALEKKDAAERAAYLDEACKGDEVLRRCVDRMLDAEPKLDKFLEPKSKETIEQPSIEERPGAIIGPYKLLQQLGEGGFGVVFMAEQEQPVRRKVALKIIKPGMDSKQVVARFEAERQALALMDHPNIARVIDGGTTDSGRPFFVMELVKGIPITEFCDKNRLTPRERLELFVPVCNAVQHAHQKGIIHRDIKPSNVLIAMYDDKPVPKVIDFGVAKAISEKLTEQTLFTRVGQVIGTLEYMSPEQATLNALDVDTRADVYALGVLLYELLTGTTPLNKQQMEGVAFLEMLRLIREVDPPKPSTRLCQSGDALSAYAVDRRTDSQKLPKLVRGELDWITMKALEKDRGRRYATPNALAKDVQNYLNDEIVEARPPSVGYRLRKLVKRNQGLVTAASAVMLTIVLGIVVATWGWIDSVQARKTAVKAISDARDIETAKAIAEAEARATLEKEQNRTKEALALAITNERLADQQRLDAETLALRAEFEHYFSKTEDRPDLALVGMATLLPKAERLKDQILANSIRLQIGAWKGSVARLTVAREAAPRVALSADGKVALTASMDNTARLWETTTGKEIGAPLKHNGLLMAVALSADGTTALTGSQDKTARLWDAATGAPIGPPLQHDHCVRAVAVSANGKVALTGCDDKTARIWDTETGKPIGPPLQHKGEIYSVALSADGKTALTGSNDKTARLWDTTTGKPIGPPLQHQNIVMCVALSTDGQVALTGSIDATAQLWEAATGKSIGPPLQHNRDVVTVALSADGKTALTGSRDNTARFWDTASGKPISPPLQHQAWLEGVALSADGKTGLTGSLDRTARLWDADTGKQIGPPLQSHGAVVRVALSSDGKTVLTASWDYKVRLWVTPNREPITPVLRGQAPIYAAAISADGKTALTADGETARLWDTASGKAIGEPLQHQNKILVVALSADAKIALVGTNDNLVHVWGTESGKPIGIPIRFKEHVYAVALNSDGKIALIGSHNSNAARLWDTATGKTFGPVLPHQGFVMAVALSANGKMALTGCTDKTARLWNTETGEPIGPLLQHQDYVTFVALSPDGKMALTGNNTEAVRIWDAPTGKPIGKPLPFRGGFHVVAFSADGKTIVARGEGKAARLYETATGKPIGPPLTHDDTVIVALSADGKVALTGSLDKTARIWQVPQPMQGDSERIILWAQVITGLEVDDLTTVRVLDAATWQERRDRLQQPGGPPVD